MIPTEKVWNVNPLASTGSDNDDFLAKMGGPLSDAALEGTLSQFVGVPIRPAAYLSQLSF
jgi:hypothetical protein